MVAGYWLITTPRADVSYISHCSLLLAGYISWLRLRFLTGAFLDTRWQISWDRYPTSIGAQLGKYLSHAVSQFLGLSEILEPKEGIFQGCHNEDGMQLLPRSKLHSTVSLWVRGCCLPAIIRPL